ncbi:MAG: AraC family transcriptional regulator [Pirellulales bacterium]|nr:AraC family transcriptional regulator [Pirellulales bacterium]
MPPRESFYHYLPVSDLAMHWGSYLTGVGYCTIAPGETYPPRVHPSLYDFGWKQGRTLPEFQTILITEGRGEFESRETGPAPIEDGSIVVLFPGVWHRYRPDPATGWTERWIGYNGEIVQRLRRLKLLRPAQAVRKIADVERLEGSFDRLLDRVRLHATQNSIVLSMRCIALLADVLEQIGGKPPLLGEHAVSAIEGIDDPLVVQALSLIWTHSHRELSVEQIARELPVSRRTLERRFQAATDRTVIEEITRCRLSRAKRLLTETDLPVKNVAHLSGFPSEEQMRIVFRQLEKTAPSEYRHKTRHRRKAARKQR